MSTPYLDTGFALKRYVQEPNSPVAKAALLAYAPPLHLTDILEMEMVNALHGKVFRREMTESDRDQCLAAFHADIAAGFWQRATIGSASLRNRVVSIASERTAIQAFARASFGEKIRMLVKLQEMAAPVLRSRGITARPWRMGLIKSAQVD